MVLLRREQSTCVTDYSPIARALYRMDQTVEKQTKMKFDVAYMMAKEGISFCKMKSLCQVQERHGINLGGCYKNEHACATFVEYIAQDLQGQLGESLHKAKFYSIQMDGSTDSGNIEEELFLVVYFDPFSADGSVHVRNRYFCVRQPKSVCATGLFESFERALAYVEVDQKPSKLIGFGCDGANVNMGDNGVKGLIQSDRPWVIAVWCLAHRLELALKDALKDTLFSDINDFLLRVYYVYSKSPKKCKELEDVVSELKGCLDFSEFPNKGGVRPLRACGTRFVAHKVSALERILDRFGAYLNHLLALTEDPKTNPTDKQKLKGYITRWREGRILIGCAVFHDILKPVSILCKSLQADELSIVSTIEAILRTTASIKKLKVMEMEDFPSVKTVLLRLKNSQCAGENSKTYQSVDIVRLDQALGFLKSEYRSYIDSVLACLHDRLKDSSADSTTLTHSLKLLATHGWQKTEDASFGYEAIQSLAQRFAIPLQEAQVNCALLQQEWEDIVYYAKQYINLVKDPYPVVWWKLFNSPDANKWTNILTLVELTFTIPLSNGHVERCFSQLKITKTNRRVGLGEDRLDQILRIRIEGPPLEEWDATKAVGLWWTDKTRRVDASGHSAPRKKKDKSTSLSDEDQEEFAWSFSDWDNWLESDSDVEGESNFLL